MAAGKGIALGLLLATTVAAGCTQHRDDSGLNTLAARLERLERRVADADKHAELTVLTQRLGNLEARLDGVEAQSPVAACHDSTMQAEKVTRPADSGSAAASPSSRAEALRERSHRFQGVAEEDRARVARIREQFRDHPDPAARRQAMSEVRAWRRAQVDATRLQDNASGGTK